LRSPSLGSDHLQPPRGFRAGDRGFSPIDLPEGVSGRAFWTTFTPSLQDEEETRNFLPELRILVASSDSTLDRTLRTVALFISLFGCAGLFAILAVLHVVVRSGLKPLDRLSADVQDIDVRQLTQRVSGEKLPQELKGVTAKLNELLDRLEASFTREKRFTSDAAHELRTPLAELRAMTELGTQWPDEFTAEHGREMLDVLLELEELLDTLSLLARAESITPAETESLELSASLKEPLERCREEAARRDLSLETRIEKGEIDTDPVLWRAIVQNLLGNAVAYAPAGSTIEVFASPDCFRVENEAPDLSREDLGQLFARFWRKSASRSEKGHSGLGLSVVRAAAEYLGGQPVASLENGRLRVEVRWTDAETVEY